MNSEPSKHIVIIHPNHETMKEILEQWGYEVIVNKYIPTGKIYLLNRSTIENIPNLPIEKYFS